MTSTLTTRVTLLEEVVNSLQILVSGCASTEALHQIILIVQQDITDLATDIEAIEARLDLLEGEVFN